MLPLHTHHRVVVVSHCTSYYNGCVSLSDVQVHLRQYVLMFSTRSGFFLFVRKTMLPKRLISTDTMPYTALESHAHAPGSPQGPTYLPPGRTLPS